MEGFRRCSKSVCLTPLNALLPCLLAPPPRQGLKFISPLEIMQAAYFVDKKRLDCTFIERSDTFPPSLQEYVPSSMPGESQEVVMPARRPVRRATSRAPSATPAPPPPPNFRQELAIESQTPAPEMAIPSRKVRSYYTCSVPNDRESL